MSFIYKITGPQFTANSSNMPNTVPTSAATGSNAGSNSTTGEGDYTGYGNATVGGATMLRILNASTGNVTITVSNNGSNVGSLLMFTNTELVLAKYSYDLVYASNTSSLVLFTPIAVKW